MLADLTPERIEHESTPEFDKLMAMFEPRFAAAPWEPGELPDLGLPPLGFAGLLGKMRRIVSAQYDTQLMKVVDHGGTSPSEQGSAPDPRESGDETGGGLP